MCKLSLSFLESVAATALLLTAFVTPAQSQSITPEDSANTVVTVEDNVFNVTGGDQSSDRTNLFHSFEQFGLSEGQIVNFLTQSEIENILGRVSGGEASLIDGLVQISGSDANLFLINPAGILFGENAQLNVDGSFTATTADQIFFSDAVLDALSGGDYAAMTGDPNGLGFSSALAGGIVNLGDLAVSEGNSLVLVGGTVVNEGSLSAPGGSVTLAAIPSSSRIGINQSGSLLNLEIDTAGLQELNATNLPTLLTGEFAEASEMQINADGSVSLLGVEISAASAVTTGTLEAASAANGGTVSVLGDRIAVLDGTLNASGSTGGGQIFVGGDYQGTGELPTAARTYISTDAQLIADATESGDGGRVIVWADEVTGFYGDIAARGGELSGDGGFVEVSGKDTLMFQGDVDTSAANGAFGTLLLDPKNISIRNGTRDGDDEGNLQDALGTNPNAPAAEVLASEPPASGTFDIFESELEGLSGDTNITLQATNNIKIKDLADDELLLQPGSGTITFTADADNNGSGGFTMSGATDVIRAEGRDVTASGATISIGAIDTSSAEDGGNITLSSSDKRIKIRGGLDASSTSSGNGGDILLEVTEGTGQINISSSGVTVASTSESGDGGDITFRTAGGNISTLDVNASTNGSGTSGDIDFTIEQSSRTIGQIDTSSGTLDTSSATGEAGSVTLSTAEGNIDTADVITDAGSDRSAGAIEVSIDDGKGSIDTTSGELSATSTESNGGNIRLSTSGGNISASNISSFSEGSGTAGDITLDIANNGSINTTTGLLDATSVGGDGGTVDLNATSGNIATANVNSFSEAADSAGGDILLTVSGDSGAIDTTAGTLTSGSTVADSGNISLSTASTTTNGNIQAGNLDASAIASADAGDITLEAGETGDIDTTVGTPIATAVDGDGGDIQLTTIEGNIQAADIRTSVSGLGNAGAIRFEIQSEPGSVGTTGGTLDASAANRDGGAVEITTEEGNIDTANVNSSSNGSGDGGDITLTVNNGLGSIDTTNGLYDATSVSGNGGDITFSTVRGNIGTNDLSAFSESDTGNGGDVTLTASGQEGSIDTTVGTISTGTNLAPGGKVTLSTVDGNISTADILSNSTGLALGGAIELSVSEGFGDIDTSIGTLDASSDTGDAGNVSLTTASGNIATSTILTRANGAGLGGDIALQTDQPGTISTTNGADPRLDSGSDLGTSGSIELESGIVNVTTADAGGGIAGNVTVSADEFNIADGGVVESVGGVLRIRTLTPDQDIVIGAVSNQGASFLDIISEDISRIAPGFSSIEIGSSEGTGTIFIVDDSGFPVQPIYLQPTQQGKPN